MAILPTIVYFNTWRAHDASRDVLICLRSSDAQKQLARNLNIDRSQNNTEENVTLVTLETLNIRSVKVIFMDCNQSGFGKSSVQAENSLGRMKSAKMYTQLKQIRSL